MIYLLIVFVVLLWLGSIGNRNHKKCIRRGNEFRMRNGW